MKSFTDKLREIIDNDENLTVYGFAKDINCERSRFQKILSGERECPADLTNHICKYLLGYTNESEIEELYELWAKDHYGQQKYNIMKSIKRRLEETKENQDFIEEELMNENDTDIYENILEKLSCSDVEQDVCVAIFEMFKTELERESDKKFYIYIPSYMEKARRAVLFMMIAECKKRNMDMESFIKLLDFRCVFSKYLWEKEAKEYYAIDNYVSACEFMAYEVSVYSEFDRVEKIDDKIFFPFYVVSSDKILFISGDGEICLQCIDKNIVVNLVGKFKKCIGEKKFEMYGLNSENYVGNVLLNNRMDESYSLSNNLCDGVFYTREIFESGLSKEFPDRELIIEMVIGFYSSYRKNGINMILSFEGLYSYIKEDSNNNLFKLSKDGKRKLLEEMLRYYKENEDKYFAIVPQGKFVVGSYFHLAVNVGTMLNFINHRDKASVLLNKMNFMSEAQIAVVMKDFYEYVAHSPMCLDKQKSLDVLEQCINSLKH